MTRLNFISIFLPFTYLHSFIITFLPFKTSTRTFFYVLFFSLSTPSAFPLSLAFFLSHSLLPSILLLTLASHHLLVVSFHPLFHSLLPGTLVLVFLQHILPILFLILFLFHHFHPHQYSFPLSLSLHPFILYLSSFSFFLAFL